VCKLQKSIYGLKQAPRAWNKKFTSDLRKSGFIPLVNAESVFTGVFLAATVFLICYVDDIVILTTSQRALKAVKSILVGLYQVKDMGELDYFLGVKIEREHGRVRLSQKTYLGNVLTRFGMTECKSAPNPMAHPAGLMAKRAPSEAERSEMRSTPFRAAIGSLLYLSTRTRPDITVAVSILAKHSQDPSPIHWQGVKRVMRYLKGTMNYGLSYSEGHSALTVYCDADWGTDDDDRRSRTGIVTFVGNNLISWTSRRQTTTSVSSCEAEYAALFEAARETAWLRNLMCEIGECPGNVATTVFHDNQGSIAWAEGGMRRVKHVELKYHYTQDMIQREQIRIEYVPSADNKADGLTKALCGRKHQGMLHMLNVVPIEREC
jgi:hypothetical protein